MMFLLMPLRHIPPTENTPYPTSSSTHYIFATLSRN